MVFLGDDVTPAYNLQVFGGLELQYLIIIIIVGVLATLAAIDMMCFCSQNCGLLACIYGSINRNKSENKDIINLDGGE